MFILQRRQRYKSSGAYQKERAERLAIRAQVLYLINLMILPGIAFLAQIWLYGQYYKDSSPLVRGHVRQSLLASLWAGFLLIIVNLGIVIIIGVDSPTLWVILILNFTVFHTTLIFLGVMGLVKAMASTPYQHPIIGNVARYPIIGHWLKVWF